MEDQALKFSKVNVYVDDQGREIHEISPANYTGVAQYAALIPMVVNEYGVTHPIRLIIRQAKNIADAFLMHDKVVDQLRQDMMQEASKPKLLTPQDLAGSGEPNKIIL